MPDTNHLETEISKDLEEDFKIAVLRELNEIQENIERWLKIQQRVDREVEVIKQSQAEIF